MTDGLNCLQCTILIKYTIRQLKQNMDEGPSGPDTTRYKASKSGPAHLQVPLNMPKRCVPRHQCPLQPPTIHQPLARVSSNPHYPCHQCQHQAQED